MAVRRNGRLPQLRRVRIRGDTGLTLHLETQATSGLQLEAGRRAGDGQHAVALLGDDYLDRAKAVGTAQPPKNLRIQRLGIREPTEPQRFDRWLERDGEGRDIAIASEANMSGKMWD